MISHAPASAACASGTSCSASTKTLASSSREAFFLPDSISMANGSSPRSLAIPALVFLFCLYGRYKSSTSTSVIACMIFSLSSSVSFPCSSMEFCTASFLSSSERRYLSLTSSSRNCSSFNAPVASLRYLEINGIVFPSSMRFTAASVCVFLMPSSFEIIAIMSMVFPF